MKKFSIFLTSVLFLFTIHATEKAVIKANEDYRKAFFNFDKNKILSFVHPDYEEISSEGIKINFAVAEKFARLTELALKDQLSLSDIMELTSIAKGLPYSDEMRKNAENLEKTEEGKKIMAAMTPIVLMLQQKAKDMLKGFAADWETFKLISCTVNGNDAKLIFTIRNSMKNTFERIECDWVKVNGKWLIRKTVSGKIDKQ